MRPANNRGKRSCSRSSASTQKRAPREEDCSPSISAAARGGTAPSCSGAVGEIDAEAEAIQRLLGRGDLRSGGAARLETQVARFEDAGWPEADLINSSYALPFCPPNQFAAIWQRIVASLRPGGRFSGQLFGDRDGWATQADMSFQTRQDAEKLLRGLEVEHFEEVEEDGETAVGDPKHWHLFHVVARQR